MSVTLPALVSGIIDGDEQAWSAACTMLGNYYTPEGGVRSAFDLITSADPYADDTQLSGADIAALSCVGVTLSQRKARDLVEDPRVKELAARLPAMTDLVDADDEVIDAESPAAELFHLLADPDGADLGWKGAEAVLARLRPALFPVITATERKALGLSKDMPEAWMQLRETLREADARLAYQLYYLIHTAPVWSDLSQIQILMALVYLDARQAKREEKERKRAAKEAAKAERKAAKRERKLAAAQARMADKQRGEEPEGTAEGEQISTAAFRLRDHS